VKDETVPANVPSDRRIEEAGLLKIAFRSRINKSERTTNVLLRLNETSIHEKSFVERNVWNSFNHIHAVVDFMPRQNRMHIVKPDEQAAKSVAIWYYNGDVCQ
jgi:hypothetical protein